MPVSRWWWKNSLIIITALFFLAQYQTFKIYFTDEQEIWDAKNEGVITDEQAMELVDLYNSNLDLNSGELSRLLYIPGFTEKDLNTIRDLLAVEGSFKDMEEFAELYPGDLELIEPFVEVYPPSKRIVGGRFKLSNYTRFEYDYEPSRYITTDLDSKNYGKLNFYFDQANGHPVRCKKRSYEYDNSRFSLILGTYKEGWGEGVLVGRNFYITTSKRKGTDYVSYLLSPYDGWMNGVYFTSKVGSYTPGIMVSYNDFGDTYSGLLSLNVKKEFGFGLDLGAVYSYQFYTAYQKFDISGGSVYFEFPTREADIKGEFAAVFFDRDTSDHKGWGINLSAYRKLEDQSVWASFWNYSDEFTSLYSDGEADGDYYKEFDIGDSTYQFRNRQAGEIGGEISTRFQMPGEIKLDVRTIYWRNKPIAESNLYGDIKLSRYDMLLDLVTLSYSRDVESIVSGDYMNEYLHTYLRKYLTDDIQFSTSLMLKGNRREDLYYISGYGWAGIDYKKFAPLELELKLRWNDSNFETPANGYFTASLEQSVDFYTVDFAFRYDIRLYEEKEEPKDHTFRFRISYNF